MKTSQLSAAGVLLAGYVQACTRVRVDQVRTLESLLVNSCTSCQHLDQPRAKRSQKVSYAVHVLDTDNKQSRDQSNPNLKYTTVTLYDDDRPPTGIVDYKSRINLEHDGWPFRGSSGHYDLALDYYQGVFAKNIGGKVSFPQLPGYAQGESKCKLPRIR